MGRFILIYIMLLLSVKFALAQEARVTATLNFTGNIGSYPIEMKLMVNSYNDTVSGEYYYLKSGIENKIYLSGILKDGDLKLIESNYNQKKKKFEKTGFFRLAYVAQTSLTGAWQKDNNNTTTVKALSVKLISRENLQAFNPLGFNFIINKKRPDYKNVTQNEARYFTIVKLQINVNKSTRWILTGFDEHNLVKDEVNLEDVNFDGYLDIKVPIYYPDMAKNDYSYIYFIYDLKSKGFKQNKSLNDLGVLDFDAVHKTLIAYDADGRGNEGTKTYK